MVTNTQNNTALLIGASGLVGQHCLKLMLEDSFYKEVIILLRRDIPTEHEKLSKHIINFDNLPEYEDIIRGNHIYCCLGTTIKKAGTRKNFKKVDFTYPLEIAKMALQNDADKYLIVTAMGANRKSMIFYNKVKGEIETALKRLSYEEIDIFRPSLLLGDRKEQRSGEELGIRLYNCMAPLFIGPLKKYKAITAEVVAKTMIECAKRDLEGVNVYESDQIQMMYDKSAHV